MCMGCGGCGCLNAHTCLALVGMVCHGHSPRDGRVLAPAICLLGGVSKVLHLDPNQLPTPALLYQGKATHGRSFTSPEGGNWEGAGPEEDDRLVAMATRPLPIHSLIQHTFIHYYHVH